MSGGDLTDYQDYRMLDWAEKLKKYNPMLAEVVEDLQDVIHTYDYYISCDWSKEDAEEAWERFRDKWIGTRISVTPPTQDAMKEAQDSMRAALENVIEARKSAHRMEEELRRMLEEYGLLDDITLRI